VKLIATVACALLLAIQVTDAEARSLENLTPKRAVVTGTPFATRIDNSGARAGYLVVKTENMAGRPSLVVTLIATTPMGDTLACAAGPITTEGTTEILFGAIGATMVRLGDVLIGETADYICDFPAASRISMTFTTTGLAASFDMTADVEWLVP
jgi:hypothetical protein